MEAGGRLRGPDFGRRISSVIDPEASGGAGVGEEEDAGDGLEDGPLGDMRLDDEDMAATRSRLPHLLSAGAVVGDDFHLEGAVEAGASALHEQIDLPVAAEGDDGPCGGHGFGAAFTYRDLGGDGFLSAEDDGDMEAAVAFVQAGSNRICGGL